MEKEMRPMTTEMLKKGYLLFPKALFEEQMNMKTGLYLFIPELISNDP